MSSTTTSTYVLGRSEQEYERLMLQGKILHPFTDRYFRMAGVSPGMRVLDIGSGMGDVALLAGEIVGPGGSVLGTDRDAKVLEHAQQRAKINRASWVSFQATTLDDFTTSEQFDAVVGRYILLYQPNAGATIRQLLQFLKPGGIVVFHELDFTDPRSSDPPCPFWDEVYALLSECFRRSGVPPDFGRRVGKAFTEAGLPFPTIHAESLIGGARGSYVYPWIARTLLSVAPRMATFGFEMPEGIAVDETLEGKLEKAVLAAGSQIWGPTQFGAWARKS